MIQVLKRNGDIDEFEKENIWVAVHSASNDSLLGADEDFATEIADLAEQWAKEEHLISSQPLTVEQIQDKVEMLLMESERKDVAKSYILYREQKNKERLVKPKQVGLLSEEFLSQYKHKEPPMTELGKFVYYRTYSRWLPQIGRREAFFETVQRAVEYNCSLLPTTKEEAEEIFDNIFNLRQFPSGRSLWVALSGVEEVAPSSNFNCSFQVIEKFQDFEDLFYLLLVGSGIGNRVFPSDIEKLPPVRTDIDLIHKSFEPVQKSQRLEHTNLKFSNDKTTVTIEIGDSKSAWREALGYYFTIHWDKTFSDINRIIMNYDNIRLAGEPLKTFGGYSSGYLSLKEMFVKLNRVIALNEEAVYKLKPIDVLDIANIIAENVKVGGIRRSSEIMLIDENDKDCVNAKKEINKKVNGKTVVNKDLLHRYMSNNTIMYKEKPTYDKLKEHFEIMRYNGEPGIANEKEMKRRNPFVSGTNPCFRGDMKLLTMNGYIPIGELDGKEVQLINKDGEISIGKVWHSGKKRIFEIQLNHNSESRIYCTGDHVFMTTDGKQVEAKNLSQKRIMPYLKQKKHFNDTYVKLGFIQGDGTTGRIKSKDHLGLEIGFGQKDKDVAEFFNVEYKKDKKSYYVNGFNKTMVNLGFSSEKLPNRELPTTIFEWDISKKKSFLRGLYSANGSCLKKSGRITLKTTCKKLVEQTLELLKEIGIKHAYITTNKKNNVKFENGTYECRESYDLNIQNTNDRILFYNEIGFIHNYKTKTLEEHLLSHGFFVKSVKITDKYEDVYDFSEPLTHWGVVEDCVVHNCFEILLDSKQNCNLSTVNAMAFVKDGQLDEKGLLNAQRLSARIGYRMTNVELELPEWNYKLHRDRLTGCSLTGWQDMKNAVGLTNDEEAALLQKLKKAAKDAIKEIAEENNMNESLLVTCVKPEGTLSQLPTVSSGVHYNHSEYYIRRIRISYSDPLAQLAIKSGFPVNPENGETWDNCKTIVIEFPVKAPNGKTKNDVSAIEQLETYKRFMDNYVDHNCSITISVKNNEWDGVIDWVYENWDSIVGVSFIPLKDAAYQQMPYEEITKENYEKRVAELPKFSPNMLIQFEKQRYDHDVYDDECSTGACPVR